MADVPLNPYPPGFGPPNTNPATPGSGPTISRWAVVNNLGSLAEQAAAAAKSLRDTQALINQLQNGQALQWAKDAQANYAAAHSQVTDFANAQYSANNAFEKAVRLEDWNKAWAPITARVDEATKKIKELSSALTELDKSAPGIADRTASLIANLRDAYARSDQDFTAWMNAYNMWYDSIARIVTLNPGSKIAADLNLVLEALRALRLEVTSGMVKKTTPTNWGW